MLAILADISISSDEIMGWITGPAGALALSAITLWWLATGIEALVRWVGSRIESWVLRGLGQVDSLIKQGKEDREMYKEQASKDRQTYQEDSEKDREMHQQYMTQLVHEFRKQGEEHEQELRRHGRKLDTILQEIKK
jgi:hypothetical protein